MVGISAGRSVSGRPARRYNTPPGPNYRGQEESPDPDRPARPVQIAVAGAGSDRYHPYIVGYRPRTIRGPQITADNRETGK
jgi:hypothetical protein